MQAKLLGYLLNALEEEERLLVEELLESDEATRQRLELLRLALLPLGSDSQLDDPPDGLGVRTCELLRKIRHR